MEQKLAQLQAKIEADPSVAERLFGLETPEEVQNFLKEQGLEFSLEEINSLRETLVKVLEMKENGELSDEDLENVAGGIVPIILLILASMGLGACIGGLVSNLGVRW